MLGLSWTEMLVIGIVALIFIGPKDLPVVMGRVGKVFGQIQRMGREFQREINKTTGLDEVRNLRNTIASPLKKTAEEIRRDFNTMTPTGPKPSGAIKPADPKAESVVDELREAAGMPAKKTNDEIAAEMGFKPTTPVEPVKAAPVKAPPVKPIRNAVAAPTAPVESADLPAIAPPKPKRPRKAATVATVDADASAVVAQVPAEMPPAVKPRKKAVRATPVATTESVAPAPKRRAPRKKPADEAGNT